MFFKNKNINAVPAEAKNFQKLYKNIAFSILMIVLPVILVSVALFFILVNSMLDKYTLMAENNINCTSDNIVTIIDSVDNGSFSQLILKSADIPGKITFDDAYVKRIMENINSLSSSYNYIRDINVLCIKEDTMVQAYYGRKKISEQPVNIQNLVSGSAQSYYSDIWYSPYVLSNGQTAYEYVFSIVAKEDYNPASDRIIVINFDLQEILETLFSSNLDTDVQFYIEDRDSAYTLSENEVIAVDNPDFSNINPKYLLSRSLNKNLKISAVISENHIWGASFQAILPAVILLFLCLVFTFSILTSSLVPLLHSSRKQRAKNFGGIKNVRPLIEYFNESSALHEQRIQQLTDMIKSQYIYSCLQINHRVSPDDHSEYLLLTVLMKDYDTPFDIFCNKVKTGLSFSKKTKPLYFADAETCTLHLYIEADSESLSQCMNQIDGFLKKNSGRLYGCYSRSTQPDAIAAVYNENIQAIRKMEMAYISSKHNGEANKLYNIMYNTFKVGIEAIKETMPKMCSDTTSYTKIQIKQNTVNVFLLLAQIFKAQEKELTATFYYALDTCLKNCAHGEYRENVDILTDYVSEAYHTDIKSAEVVSMKKYVSDITRYIEENYQYNIGLDGAAEALNITKQHLCNIIKHNFNSTFVTLLNDYRIKEASKLLLATEDSVEKIAHAVGYNGSNYFISQFKSRSGLTPREYRRNRNHDFLI